jgi:chromate reductase
MTRKIAVLVGSVRKDSFSRKIARNIAALAPKGYEFEEVDISKVGFYNQDLDGHEPAEWLELRGKIASADAVLFVTPEYNRSVPGVLKNAIDIASRPWGANSFAGKPAGVLGISVGSIGTALAQQHLRNVLAYLDVPTLGQPEVFMQFKEGLVDEDGTIGPDDTRAFLQGFVDQYVAWVRKHAGEAR